MIILRGNVFNLNMCNYEWFGYLTELKVKRLVIQSSFCLGSQWEVKPKYFSSYISVTIAIFICSPNQSYFGPLGEKNFPLLFGTNFPFSPFSYLEQIFPFSPFILNKFPLFILNKFSLFLLFIWNKSPLSPLLFWTNFPFTLLFWTNFPFPLLFWTNFPFPLFILNKFPLSPFYFEQISPFSPFIVNNFFLFSILFGINFSFFLLFETISPFSPSIWNKFLILFGTKLSFFPFYLEQNCLFSPFIWNKILFFPLLFGTNFPFSPFIWNKFFPFILNKVPLLFGTIFPSFIWHRERCQCPRTPCHSSGWNIDFLPPSFRGSQGAELSPLLLSLS